MIPKGLVSFIYHHTLDLLGGAGTPGQVIGEDLWGKEEDSLLLPCTPSLLRGHGP